MQHNGFKLFESGVLPVYEGSSAGPKLQNGTGGNFAARNRTYPERFVVTASGTHKGRLTPKDFVEVIGVNFKKKHITIRRSSDDSLPSTDSLLVASAFKAHPDISAWIHFHVPLPTAYSVKFDYPCLSSRDLSSLASLIHGGARIINMIDHNLYIKPCADNTADAVIILENTLEIAFSDINKLLATSAFRG